MSVDDMNFGRFHYDPAQRLLFCDGDPVSLGRRSVLLLDSLLRRRGEVLRKDELIEAAWPGTAVEESNLSVQIAHIRKRIGGTWIRTVERVGYVFAVDGASQSPPTRALASSPAGVAVLAFTDFSGHVFLPLGNALADAVISALARFRSVSVAARSSSFQFDCLATDARDIARRLQVRYVVQGSIRRSAGRLRLSLQLIDGVSGTHLWADGLEMEAAQPLSDTDELVGRAAAMIEGQVHLAEIGRAEREQPTTLQGYDFYLQGRKHVLSSRENDNAAGYTLFSEGLKLMPNSVPLLAAIAEVIHHRKAVGWRPFEGVDERATLELIQRGLDRPDLDAASLALFASALHTAGEEDLGANAAERAVAMNPNSPLVLVCAGLQRLWAGNVNGAESAFRRAVDLSHGDPTQRFALQGMAKVYSVRGNNEETLIYARRTLALSPGLSAGHWHLIASSTLLGRLADARRHYARYQRIAPGVTIESVRRGQIYRNPAHIAPLLEGLRLAGMPAR